ncbi:MAG TPA: cytochrome C oxidase subunit IV family protein [Dehalococcoidia bacterium]|nr:cytochrome C oxidase subunit IV family protein [Dehalococcoidia bacterium]
MGFWENPELLFGIPFLAIGAIGVLIALGALAGAETEGGAVRAHVGHPDEAEYVKIGIALAVITAVEVALFYIELSRDVLIPLLIVLSAGKFFLVVAWFMHLRFDSRIFTTAFVSGFILAAAVFTVVLATLGSNLV